MLRKINFLGKQNLAHQNVTILTNALEDGRIEVRVAALDLPQPRGLPADEWRSARVILKARDKVADAYFEHDLGSVGEVTARSGTLMTGIMPNFAYVGAIRFDLAVISSSKRYLCKLENFPASNDKPLDRDEILKVRHEDLGERSWFIDWSDVPELVINTRYAATRLHTSECYALIMEPAFHQVLVRAATLKAAEDDAAEDWVDAFVDFGVSRAGALPEDCDPADARILAWADVAVGRFAQSAMLLTNHLATASEE